MRYFTKILLLIMCGHVLTVTASNNIFTIEDMKIFERELHNIQKNEDILVIFDIDHVLIMPTDETTQNRHSFRKILWDEITNNLSDSEVRLLSSIIKERQEWRIVDSSLPNILEYLEKTSTPTIALTTRGTGKLGILPNLENKTQENLSNLGIRIHYPKAFHKKRRLSQFKNPDGMPVLQKGIISTSELCKGKILGEYLRLLNYIPNKIIFIDDKIKNIESVLNMSKKFNIEFVGYHYIGAAKAKKNISINQEAERLRFKILAKEHRWLSEPEAINALGR